MSTSDQEWMKRTARLNPELYDLHRPSYPPALFDTVIEYAAVGPDTRCLEIGMGTGQATEPFLRAGCSIVALEPTPSLAEFARAKYAEQDRLTIQPTTFDELEPGARFDLIYAATSFHWIPGADRMSRVCNRLAPEGCVALFWNHPAPQDPVHAAMQEVYRSHLPNDPKQNAERWQESDAEVIAEALADAGFRDVQTHVFRQERNLTTGQYIGLLNTYSDHLNLPEAIRTALLHELAAVIDAHGGTIRIADTVDLHLGRR